MRRIEPIPGRGFVQSKANLLGGDFGVTDYLDTTYDPIRHLVKRESKANPKPISGG